MTRQDALNLLIELFPLLLPILLIQLGIVVYALVDIMRAARTRGPRWAWILGLVVTSVTVPGGIILAAFYLFWGRKVEAEDDTDREA